MDEIKELEYNYLKSHLPVRNPNRPMANLFNYLYPDIHKHNPEYVQQQDKEKKVWTMYHVKDDLYIKPGLNNTNGFLGVIFTNKPYSTKEVIIKI